MHRAVACCVAVNHGPTRKRRTGLLYPGASHASPGGDGTFEVPLRPAKVCTSTFAEHPLDSRKKPMTHFPIDIIHSLIAGLHSKAYMRCSRLSSCASGRWAERQGAQGVFFLVVIFYTAVMVAVSGGLSGAPRLGLPGWACALWR